MTHRNPKEMLFHFLKSRDYNQDSGKLAHDNGYDLGDYFSENKIWYDIARDCAQLLRTRLAGVFNQSGEIVQEKQDYFGEFH